MIILAAGEDAARQVAWAEDSAVFVGLRPPKSVGNLSRDKQSDHVPLPPTFASTRMPFLKR